MRQRQRIKDVDKIPGKEINRELSASRLNLVDKIGNPRENPDLVSGRVLGQEHADCTQSVDLRVRVNKSPISER